MRDAPEYIIDRPDDDEKFVAGTRWEFHVTWRDRDGREWSSPPIAREKLPAARALHAAQVLNHKSGHTDRTHVLVHQIAKFEKGGEGKWSPAGWDGGTGTVEIGWPVSKNTHRGGSA